MEINRQSQEGLHGAMQTKQHDDTHSTLSVDDLGTTTTITDGIGLFLET